ncbi:MAG TPA: hypothetical protein VFU52_03780, partial [Gaiellaceae bacterium]|nr:hypothetical protein [Gaiellaceae bacterium]
RRKGGLSPGASTARSRALSAPYVGHGIDALSTGVRSACVTVGGGVVVGDGGVELVCGRLLPQPTSTPAAAAISPAAARRPAIAAPR